MSGNQKKRILLVVGALLGVFLSACGGGGGGGVETATGGGGGGAPLPSQILSWSPPSTYTDSTPLNPAADLDSFEIYVNTSGSFSNSDTPAAYVQAVDPVSHQVLTEFNLANLGPYLSKGVSYQVSLRAVALTGARSEFSPPASFSF